MEINNLIFHRGNKVGTGVLWYVYAFEKTTTNTVLVQYLLAHLSLPGVSLSDVTIQTDGGSEFTNEYISIHDKPTSFKLALREWGVAHLVNPPSSPIKIPHEEKRKN